MKIGALENVVKCSRTKLNDQSRHDLFWMFVTACKVARAEIASAPRVSFYRLTKGE